MIVRSPAMSMFRSDTASPAVQFWMSALCMTAAAVLAPGAVIGIAAFPLFIIALVYGMKGFRLLPSATQRPHFMDAFWFFLGLIGVLLSAVLHGAMAFAMTHPEEGALPPPVAVTLAVGVLPVLLCIYAVEQRTERGWAIATALIPGLLLVNPAVLLLGRTLQLPAVRTW